MIGQAEDMGFALECFAEEAAEKVAQLCAERLKVCPSADQMHTLGDSIWECLCSCDHPMLLQGDTDPRSADLEH